MRNSGLLVLFFFFFFVQGCATFDGLLVRRTDASEFLSKIEERTAAVLASDEKFTLDRCLRIALDNNLDMKTADLEKRVATLNRRIAFANFLPKITFDYKSTELNNAPATALFGSISTPMQDRIVRDTAVQAQMPIFAPSTWFLYALHQRGEEISEAAAAYTRQMIALQVTGLYFQCLATEESRRMLEAQHAAASELMKEAAAYYGEGMVTDADIAQVRVLLLVREKALEFNARARERCLAELLTVMGLAPTASIELEVST
ncbi:MAG: TolC family protein, partial [Candidatus Hydrogenedentes bacterium]|nr:TolC family protein [Candidatus Hydrogenedentota bacterium]